VDQAQERRVPKEEYDTFVDLDDVLQINNSLANERNMQKENSKEEDEEASIAKNCGDDDELPKAYQPVELSDEDLERFSILF
jgi:uncharacterized protein YacL (UPF0231 family)